MRNLVGTRWLTDNDLIYFINLINTKISNTLCFVLQHPSAMFSHKPLLDKMESICGKEVVEKIIIILNIARTDKGETNIALEGTDKGCHWTLLFFKRNSPVWYYGDSLRWSFPLNPLCLENILMQAEKSAVQGSLPPECSVYDCIIHLTLVNITVTGTASCFIRCKCVPVYVGL